MNLYLDIETIPSQSPEVHAQIAESITPPGNYKKPESIAQWEAEQKPALVKEAIARTALDGSTGHVCCIGWAIDDNPPYALNWVQGDPIGEVSILDMFISECVARIDDPFHVPTIIGHNVINFDIRFLWQRAIILGVKMPAWFPRDPKPWSGEVFDTMTAFAGHGNRIGLDRLCRALGLPGKEDIDGSMVGDLWAAGEYNRISEYCRADVDRTRAVHKRMQVAFGELAA